MTTPKRHCLPTKNKSRGQLSILILCKILAFVTTDTNYNVIGCGNNTTSAGSDATNKQDEHLRQSFPFGMDGHYDYTDEEQENSSFTNLVVIEVQREEFEKVLDSAKNIGFQIIGKVFKDEDLYLLRQENEGRRVRRNLKNLLLNLYSDPRIKSIAPQYGVERHRRYSVPASFDVLLEETKEIADGNTLHPKEWLTNSEKKHTSLRFNDPLYKDQWYLVNRYMINGPNTLPHDINVLPVWRAGINGTGVRISVLDDGVHMRNPEITRNYNPFLSFDYTNLKRLRPEDVPENSHGTYCAAIAAGVANNRYCGVGVAYGAHIGGPRILDALITDVQEAMALTQALDYVDIYTASWGPKDNGKKMAGPGTLARMALVKGVTQGRQGLGAIYVWAAGNGGVNYDNCNADGYASSIYTLTFGAVTDTGRSTYYSEPCAAVIASTYIGGSHLPPTIDNIAELKKKIKVVVPEPHGRCRKTFQGTSAAAPMASGVIALVLQANPKLSWRDVQHIIIESSRIPSWLEPGWSINAAGKHYHLKIGFGVLDAAGMVAMAKNWTSIERLKRWTLKAIVKPRRIKAGHTNTFSLTVTENRKDSSTNIRCLETVVATINITHHRRRDLELFLVSPAGTVSEILTRRPHDEATHIFMWNFTSLHFWGENPFGKWRLLITDAATSVCRGFISYFSLTFLGTSALCLNQVKPVRNLNTKQLISLMKRDENLPILN